MGWIVNRQSAFAVAAMTSVMAFPPAVQAQDFFSALFGGMGIDRPAPAASLPYNNDSGEYGVRREPRQSRGSSGSASSLSSGGGRQAFCVRTCDGRYFPAPSSNGQSRAATCNSFCPASETRVVYGSTIDSAATETGKPYSELPNAFRYRNELVSGCTCNGKDHIGLAPVRIEDDPTLRKGDLVATSGGLMVAGAGSDRRHAALNFSPAPAQVRARYQAARVVASE
jgi:hypothetical protein